MMPADMVSRAPDATAKNAADGVNPVRNPCTNARSQSQNTTKIIVVPLGETRGQNKRSLYQKLEVNSPRRKTTKAASRNQRIWPWLKRRGAMGEAFDAPKDPVGHRRAG
jgi:hypothetical protein